MDELFVKLRLLAKAEAILVRLHLRRAVRQVALVVVAALFGLLALAMLNVALFLYLVPTIGQANAALAAAGFDLLVAVVAVIAAARMELGPEAASAESLRDLLSSQLTADADRLRTQIEDLQQDIKRIRDSLTGIIQPGGIGLPMIFQWLMTFVGFLRRRRG